MKAITTCNCSVNTLYPSFEGMREDITLIKQHMHNFKERVSADEKRICTLEDSVHSILKTTKKCHTTTDHT